MQLNLAPMLADLNIVQGGISIIVAVVIVIVVFLPLYMVFSRYTKVGPNQVLIVSGRKHKLEDGTTSRLPHRQRRRHVRHADFGKGGHAVARIADH